MIRKAMVEALLLSTIAGAIFETRGANSVTLAWDPSPDNVAGYIVYAAVAGASQAGAIDVGNATTAIINNLVAGAAYSFYVTAYDSNRVESVPSNAIDYSLPANPSHFLQADTISHGNWKGVYGSEGWWVIGAATNIPSYATVSTTAAQWIWGTSANSVIAPLLPGNTTNRIAACRYSAGPSDFVFTINDGQVHRLTMYFLDWTHSGRVQKVDLIDSQSGAVLDTQTLSNFAGGIYLTWEVAGAVIIRMTPYNVNAVVSAIFFDPIGPPVAARFVNVDTTTRGNWMTRYGQEGSIIAMDAMERTPSYASVSLYQYSQWTYWTDGRDDRALMNNEGAARLPGIWYSYYPSTNSFYMDIAMNDTVTHQIAVYALDWYGQGRALQIDVLNAVTNEILDTQQLSSYATGSYLVWDVKGSVRLRVSTLAGPNAMISGLFFGPPSAPL